MEPAKEAEGANRKARKTETAVTWNSREEIKEGGVSIVLNATDRSDPEDC